MVHTFKCLDNYFMLDVESGSFFIIDKITKNIIDNKNSSSNFLEEGFSDFSSIEYLEAKKEIDSLIKDGVLFVEQIKADIPKYNGIVKSMCLNISHKCNLTCGYCFADGGSYSGDKLNMDFDTARNAVDLLIEKSGTRRNLELDFFGGEPLLNLDVVKKTVRYARGLEKAHNKIFRFTITTNALALTEEITDFFNEEMHNVVISIDGRENIHNAVRRTLNNKDSFDLIIDNVKNFVKKRGDKQYYIRGTFTSKNKDFANDALFLNDCGFNQISLEPVVLPDNHELAIKQEDLHFYIDEYEKLAKEYLLRRKTDKWFSFFHFNIDVLSGPCESKRLFGCGAGCEYVAVIPGGDIFPCHQFASNKNFIAGNVNNKTFDSSMGESFIKNNVLAKDECNNCWAKYYCSGGCAANAVNFNGVINKPYKQSCELMKKRLECSIAIKSLETQEI